MYVLVTVQYVLVIVHYIYVYWPHSISLSHTIANHSVLGPSHFCVGSTPVYAQYGLVLSYVFNWHLLDVQLACTPEQNVLVSTWHHVPCS